MLDWDGPAPRRDLANAADATSRTDGAPDQPRHDLPPDAPPTDSALDAIVPPNTTCAKALPVTLAGGKGGVSGDTTHFLDEHSALKCKEAGKTSLTAALDGGQLYSSWSVKQGDWYKLTLQPKTATAMYLYTFNDNTCTAVAIGADCQAGLGQAIGVWSGETEALYYQATATGSAFFTADSPAASSGSFTATVEAITQPNNATCAAAQQITLSSGGKGSVSGDTGPALTSDEFSSLRCGGRMTDRLSGPQVYYSVDLTSGATYLVSVTAAAATNLYAYIFGGACTEAAIRADCTTNNAKGAVTGVAANSLTATLSFTPTKTGTYKIAVDSKDPSHFGGFTLKVEKQP